MNKIKLFEIALLFVVGAIVIGIVAASKNNMLFFGKQIAPAEHASAPLPVTLSDAYAQNIPTSCTVTVLDPKRLGEISDDAILEKLYLSDTQIRLDLQKIGEAGTTTQAIAIMKENKVWSWEEGATRGFISSTEENTLEKFIQNYTNQDVMRLDCVHDDMAASQMTIPQEIEFSDIKSDFVNQVKAAAESAENK